jgi:hypothetical protein
VSVKLYGMLKLHIAALKSIGIIPRRPSPVSLGIDELNLWT